MARGGTELAAHSETGLLPAGFGWMESLQSVGQPGSAQPLYEQRC